VRFFVEVQGLDRLVTAIDSLRREIEEPLPILDAVAERAFYPIVQEIFDTEGRGQWPELTPAYAEHKREKFGDKPLMQATTALVTSLTKKGATMNIHTAQGRDSLLLGSALTYARPASKRRPVFDFNQDDFGRMEVAARDKVKEDAEHLGFDAK